MISAWGWIYQWTGSVDFAKKCGHVWLIHILFLSHLPGWNLVRGHLPDYGRWTVTTGYKMNSCHPLCASLPFSPIPISPSSLPHLSQEKTHRFSCNLCMWQMLWPPSIASRYQSFSSSLLCHMRELLPETMLGELLDRKCKLYQVCQDFLPGRPLWLSSALNRFAIIVAYCPTCFLFTKKLSLPKLFGNQRSKKFYFFVDITICI